MNIKGYGGLISVSALTQLLLLASQLVLLPVQLSIWGEVRTAGWYSSLAVAMLASVADLGFRVKGHDELIIIRDQLDDTHARERFSTAWFLVRTLVLISTLAIALVDVVVHLAASAPYRFWRISLIVALGVETLVVVRVMYFDTFRQYVSGELGYLTLIATRVAAALVALLLFDWSEVGLANVFLASSVAGLLLQERLCTQGHPFKLLERTGTWPTWRAVTEAPRTMADPLTNWARLSLPVLVLGQIAPPSAITAYVALRAVFSALRSVLQQLARVGSTEYLFIRTSVSPVQANHVMTVFLVTSAFLASVAGLACLLDRVRLVQYWVSSLDTAVYMPLAAAFAVSAAFYPYQILLATMMRQGQIAKIARIEYGYLLSIAILSLLIVAIGTLQIYPLALAASEIGLAMGFYWAFAGPQINGPRNGFQASLMSVIIMLCAVTYVFLAPGIQGGRQFPTLLQVDLLVGTVSACLLAAVAWRKAGFAYRAMRRASAEP